MKENLYKNKIIISLVAIAVLAISAVIVWQKSDSFKRAVTFWEEPRIVNDTIAIPETTKITSAGGRSFVTTGQKVALVPKTKGEEVLVSYAIFTLKSGFEVANSEAKKWSPDARLIYAKSLGTVDLNGKSSAWQYAFGSKQKKKGYEIIIQGEGIVSQKETEATSFGYDLPKNWYDSSDAILSLQASSPFKDESLGALTFFYGENNKIWQYAFSTSFGNTLMQVK